MVLQAGGEEVGVERSDLSRRSEERQDSLSYLSCRQGGLRTAFLGGRAGNGPRVAQEGRARA